MRSWLSKGFFPAELLVKRIEDDVSLNALPYSSGLLPLTLLVFPVQQFRIYRITASCPNCLAQTLKLMRLCFNIYLFLMNKITDEKRTRSCALEADGGRALGCGGGEDLERFSILLYQRGYYSD